MSEHYSRDDFDVNYERSRIQATLEFAAQDVARITNPVANIVSKVTVLFLSI